MIKHVVQSYCNEITRSLSEETPSEPRPEWSEHESLVNDCRKHFHRKRKQVKGLRSCKPSMVTDQKIKWWLEWTGSRIWGRVWEAGRGQIMRDLLSQSKSLDFMPMEREITGRFWRLLNMIYALQKKFWVLYWGPISERGVEKWEPSWRAIEARW